MICAQGSCVNGFRDGSGNLNVVGGTSVGAPTFAGIVAILNQATQFEWPGQYQPHALHSGSIDAHRISRHYDGQQHCAVHPWDSDDRASGGQVSQRPAPSQFGYSAGTGYDLVTGLGSLDANVLVTSWPGFVATPSFSVGVTAATITAPGQTRARRPSR